MCTALLGTKSFIFRSSHEVLSSCTLPNWVPESVAADAIHYYKHQLRTALIELMSSPTVGRNRTKSAQSERLSLDSLEEDIHTATMMGYYKSTSNTTATPNISHISIIPQD
jgi:hypothetical protein